jgi:uncharacterized membrane protein
VAFTIAKNIKEEEKNIVYLIFLRLPLLIDGTGFLIAKSERKRMLSA